MYVLLHLRYFFHDVNSVIILMDTDFYQVASV